jgi:thiol:disulfide interchange protein DsbC
VGKEFSYVDATGRYMFVDGHLIDISNPDQPRDLTMERMADIKKINFDSLPLDKAIKTVIGNGKRRLAIFEDPHCPHCHALRKAMAAGLTDVTIYAFPVSFQRNDGFKLIESSYCAENPSSAWLEVMQQGAQPPLKADCGAPIQEINALANKFEINGTPTIYLESGERIDGFVPINEWQHKIASK